MKKIWYVIIIGTISGIVLMGTGYSMGAKLWIYADFSGVHVVDTTKEEYVKKVEEVTEEFESIYIDVYSSDIEIISTDRYGIEIIKNDIINVDWGIKNGILEISEKNKLNKIKFFNINFNFHNFTHDIIKVYVPQEAEFQIVNLKNSSGDLRLSDITCSELELKLISGDAAMKNSSIGTAVIKKYSGDLSMTNCDFIDANINNTSGNIELFGINSQGIYIKNSSGDIRYSGKLLGTSEIRSISGDVKLQISGAASEYDKNFKLTSGNLYINGKNMKDYSDINKISTGNTLKIQITSGNAIIDFTEI